MSGGEEGRVPEVSPGTDVGGYTVEAPLGEGGFGTVFRARRGGALYALKLLPLEEVGEWAVRELLNLARVQHPNVVRLLGHGQWPDKAPRYFVIIMEYVAGRRLDVWASAENPSGREAVRKVLGLAQGLAALHAAKVVEQRKGVDAVLAQVPEPPHVLNPRVGEDQWKARNFDRGEHDRPDLCAASSPCQFEALCRPTTRGRADR